MQESCYLRGVRGLAPASSVASRLSSEASRSELRSLAFQAPICPCRDKAMTLQIRSEKKCGITWRCSACKKRRGFFTDSSFEDSSVPPSTWIVLFYHWANGASKETMAKESGRSYDFVCRFCQRCRNLVANWNEDNNDALGGPGMVVEVDETEYGRKRKGVHGKEADPKLDVWGCLDRMGYKWHGVNHSDGEFVREVEVQARGKTKILPVHSQSIDSIWRHMKDFLAKNAFRQEDYPSYVEEWQWRHNYQAVDRFRMLIFSLTLYPF